MMILSVRRAAIAALLMIGAAACRKGSASVGPDDPVCGSCASVYTNGGIPCDGTSSSDAYDALLLCACDLCSLECNSTLCAAAVSDEKCGACLEARCPTEQGDCAAN